MVFKIFPETSAIDHHFLTSNLWSIIDHQIWVSKLVNGLQNFSRNFSDRSLFFNTKFAIDHQICMSKLVNGLQNFSRNFSDRSPFFNIKFAIDHWPPNLSVKTCKWSSKFFQKLQRSITIFLHQICDRSPNLCVKTCKWPSKFFQKLQRSITRFGC